MYKIHQNLNAFNILVQSGVALTYHLSFSSFPVLFDLEDFEKDSDKPFFESDDESSTDGNYC